MATGSTEQELRLELNKLYLVIGTWASTQHNIQEIYVEEITERAYKLKRYRADRTHYFEWIEIEKFYEDEEIFEELPLRLIPEQDSGEPFVYNYDKITRVCPICGGVGQLPDDTVTSGKKMCPKCNGTCRVFK